MTEDCNETNVLTEVTQYEKTDYLTFDFEIPNHSNELIIAEGMIRKLKSDIRKMILNNDISKKLHDQYYDEVVKMLDYVGSLSVPCFTICFKMENMYFLKYRSNPSKAKQLWLQHYDELHHPYTILKNRCFTLIDELDEAFILKFKTNPPNWDI